MKKTLLYVPSARNVKLVHSWLKRVNFVDKLIVRYYHKDDADKIAQRFFFKNKYDYLIMTTDDVIGNPDHIRLLLSDMEKYNCPVVTGWCNHKHGYASVSVKPIDYKNFMSNKAFTRYNFVTIRDIIFAKHGYPFFETSFTGMALTLIRKDILKRVPCRGFLHSRDKLCKGVRKKTGREVMQDLAFSQDCTNKNIPVTVDARIFLLHLFGTKMGLKLADWPNSKVKKEVRFVEATENI